MGNLIGRFISSKRETKWFILNWTVYGFLLIATSIYCYLRLDYVRSFKTAASSQEEKHPTLKL